MPKKENPLIKLINLMGGIAYADGRHIHIEIPLKDFCEYINTWEVMENGKEDRLSQKYN